MGFFESKRENYRREYGILCQRVYPRKSDPTPFGSTLCIVEPGGATTPHNHHEGETFFITRGEGWMQLGDGGKKLKAGDSVYIPAFTEHQLRNLSTSADLEFISVWWEGADAARPRIPARSFITVAPPTPNGELHLGHLSGPYVAADVYARYVRLRGGETHFMTGSDDNQSYVPVKAKKLGLTSEETAAMYGDSIESTFHAAGMEIDEYLRPLRTPEYVSFVQTFFVKLYDAGKVELREVDVLLCENCDRQLFEAHVRGKCPHCGAATNAHGCEACGVTNDAIDLGEPHCNHCSSPATRTRAKKFYFPLSQYAERLASWYPRVKMNGRLRAFTQGLLDRGLSDVSASFQADWGIPVPIRGFENQVIYEWLEMAAGYLFMAKKLERRRDWNPFKKSSDHELVQFFGFDNGFFYTSFLPALFMAFENDSALPSAFVTNEFFRLEGLKFSTSRNHAIWAREILEHVPSDVVRFHLAANRPETEQTNFTMAAFETHVKEELVGRWEALFAELDAYLAEDFAGVSPEAAVQSSRQLAYLNTLSRIAGRLEEHYGTETFSMNGAAKALSEIVSVTTRFLHEEAFSRKVAGRRTDWATAVALALTGVDMLGRSAGPLMPELSEKLRLSLGVEGRWTWESEAKAFPSGRKIGRLHDYRFTLALKGISAFASRR